MHKLTIVALFAVLVTTPLLAQEIGAEQRLEPAVRQSTERALTKAASYLVAAQRPDGAWEAFDRPHPAITALVVAGLAKHPDYGPSHPNVQRGLQFILTFVQPDGGIYIPDEGLHNYNTSVALIALAAMNDDKLAGRIRAAQDYLKKLQWDERHGHEISSSWYGGAGYGKSKRPDLSNTQLMLEALHESGLPADDPVYRKAMVFISRSQMLASSNDQPFAESGGDGGFIYTPANGGESKAGTEIVEGRPRLRSYGSMTYAGFKSMLYAKVDRDDPRVKAAVDWIRQNYTLDQNPNMPVEFAMQGLYYYYHVFAKAMQAWGVPRIQDGRGASHVWRTELCKTLVLRQNDDGSWVNSADRWYEGNPHLTTAYALLALQAALAD